MQNLAKQKLPSAEYVLGAWEVKGDIVPKDVSGGLESIQRAADKKYGPALFFMGKSKMEGNLLEKDPPQGLSLMREAAEFGSKQAQFTLGAMYEKGDGVAVDPDRAKKYFRLCAAYGTPECEFRLGKLLLDSPEHRKRDWLQAVAWLELAEDHNLAAARAIVEPEVAKLTPQQAKSLAGLERQLEHRP
jgi:TPR repeat protein